jgi:two-component system CheB/CheR fusion protein
MITGNIRQKFFSVTICRRLFESAKEGIAILDYNTGHAVDVNPFLIELLGYSYKEFLGTAHKRICPHQEYAS